MLCSRIEGTQASLSDLVLFDAEAHTASGRGDVGEVYNYVQAVGHVLDPARRLPLSVSLLREAHAILLTGVRGGYATPGEFRRSQNWIGPPGCTLRDATYVPPPPERLWDCLDPFEKYRHATNPYRRCSPSRACTTSSKSSTRSSTATAALGMLSVRLLSEWDCCSTHCSTSPHTSNPAATSTARPSPPRG